MTDDTTVASVGFEFHGMCVYESPNCLVSISFDFYLSVSSIHHLSQLAIRIDTKSCWPNDLYGFCEENGEKMRSTIKHWAIYYKNRLKIQQNPIRFH